MPPDSPHAQPPDITFPNSQQLEADILVTKASPILLQKP